ncbi:single-stranded DNA-binding protein [Allochromatium humboldtianum]|uniref:Single-stranded DNA-binding protein n=1 Tax=Allochromatium humboldtianum TaxID=504901 RepID=A0A850RS09_9GAMM|nr:single-stranded DNA-binding protein [Allochromatium humboldtianum]NVZ11703.1 single-stranded DNA-binding protein [Allochromatium humboldtianum]
MDRTDIIGNLTKDAEVRKTASGQCVCNFTVAVNNRRDKDKARTKYYDCGLWGKRAESTLPQYLTKGKKVWVSGDVNARAYIPKEGGEPKVVLTLMVDEIELLGGDVRANGDNSEGGSQLSSQSTPPPAPKAPTATTSSSSSDWDESGDLAF